MVLWKDPLDNNWHGPDPVLIWGRGQVCVFPQDAEAPRWLPERLVCQTEEITESAIRSADFTAEESSPNKSADALILYTLLLFILM